MKKLPVFTLVTILLVVMVGCAPGSSIEVNTTNSSIQLSAPGPNPLVNQPDAQGRIASAGSGLWHGLISPITLILSFFDPTMQMYEVHNSGSAYNLGFLFGVALIFALIALFSRLRRQA